MIRSAEESPGADPATSPTTPDDSPSGDGNARETEDSVPSSPDGARYAVERWLELTDIKTSWWARPTGVGLSLQLNEIKQLSIALQEGKVVAGAVERLLAEAHETFVSDGRYAAEAFPEIKKDLRGALKGKEAPELLPGGAALAAVEAAQAHLAKVDIVDRLITDIAMAAKQANALDDFLAIDERITLLDAELAFMGYSLEWRSQAAHAVRDGLNAAHGLSDALGLVLDAESVPDISTYEAFVPLLSFQPEGDIALVGTMIEREEAEERLVEWTGGSELLGELEDAEAVLRIPNIEARDIDAAAEQARDSLARHVSLWKLQGVNFKPGNSLLLRVGNHAAGKRLTRRGWVKRPSGLKAYEAAREGHEDDVAIRRITDALDQLAQARSGSQGASLADLWTVSETLFGGLAADKSAEVSDQLAGVAEYLYVRDLLRWLGSRFDPDMIDLEGLALEGETPGEWALRCARERSKSLPEKLVEADWPLEWVRFRQVLRWDQRMENPKDKCHLGRDLETVADRVAAVGNRAYLVRNLFLHQGNPERAAAMAVTLPIFASVLRAVVGHINRESGERRLPLVESQLARLKVQHVSAAYFAKPHSGPEPLAEFVDLTR